MQHHSMKIKITEINMRVLISELGPPLHACERRWEYRGGKRWRGVLALGSEWESKGAGTPTPHPQGQLINHLAGKALQMTAFLFNLARLFLPLKGPLGSRLLFTLRSETGKPGLHCAPLGVWPPSLPRVTIRPSVLSCVYAMHLRLSWRMNPVTPSHLVSLGCDS